MDYRDPNLIKTLAAEYVLGTLRGAARQRFERILRSNAGARADVYFWELRLTEMTGAVPPVQPSERAWLGIRNQMAIDAGLNRAAQVPRHQSARGRRLRRSTWRLLVGSIAAAAIVLAVLLSQHGRPRQIDTLAGHAGSTEAVEWTDAPVYVTLLKIPESSMQWLVSLSLDQHQMRVVAAGDYAESNSGTFQLWWIPQHAAPMALGTLPGSGGASIDIALPQNLIADGDSQFTLAVSLEPAGAKPSDLPNGPVVTSAQNLAAPRQQRRGL